MSYRIEVFKTTDEDWYGSYILNGYHNGVKNQMLVTVSFCGNISPPDSMPIWRTCVWGNDDCGMEFDSDSETVALNMFYQVLGMKHVNRSDLKNLGFISA